MYYDINIAHRIIVTLFLLQYLVKLILLLTGKKESLANYTKSTRIPEMIVSVGFLVTGAWMLMQPGATLSTLMLIKLFCVVASIPLAVIGFKRGNKALAALSVVLILAAYGLAEVNHKKAGLGKVDTSNAKSALEAGAAIYQQKNCVSCHGADGKLAANGAKDLSVTVLPYEEQKGIIKNGKNLMPAYTDLTPDQLDAVVAYVATFKK